MNDRTFSSSVNPPRIIGLTGGIGMGKSTVSDYLAQTYEISILDADIYAREAVEPGAPLLIEIIERYGTGLLLSNGWLDRQRLGEIVFGSSAERLWLEQRIHPYVRDRFETELKNLPQSAATIVLSVPLLFEARMTDLVNEIWVVFCPLEQQIDRLIGRDRLTRKQAQARIKSQFPIERKLKRADVILDNSTTPEALFQQIDSAIQQPHR